MSPVITMPDNRVAALAVAIGRCAQSEKSSIGSLARRSWTTNKAAAMTKSTAGHNVPSPDVPASVRATIRDAMAMVKSAAPAVSIERASRFTSSCRKARKPSDATRPIGTLIQKIQDQLACWMMRPPQSGPRTDETPQTLAR